jgi:hypothetical protein
MPLNIVGVVPDFKGIESFGDIERRFVKVAQSIMLEHRLSTKISDQHRCATPGINCRFSRYK